MSSGPPASSTDLDPDRHRFPHSFRGGGRGRGGGGGRGHYHVSTGRGSDGGPHTHTRRFARSGSRGTGRTGGGRSGRGDNQRDQETFRGRGGRGRASEAGDNTFIEEFGVPANSLRVETESPIATGECGNIGIAGDSTSTCRIPTVSVAVEGCCHGELDAIYERLLRHQERTGQKIDLLLCCGDFQSLRNMADFHSLAVPPKYRSLGSFWKYYAGDVVAPILTIFVGGNHEASQSLMELYYGGWVAPNIYYLGAAGVVQYRGLRIGGVSGIYKSNDYTRGRFERIPLDPSSLRSVYHVRSVDVYRMSCLSRDHPLDIMLTHDWPQGIEQFGDTQDLLRRKPFFADEVRRNELGSPPYHMLLQTLQPRWWFAAHLHVKFKATFKHDHCKSTGISPFKDSSVTSLIPSQVANSVTATRCDTATQPMEESIQLLQSPRVDHSTPDETKREAIATTTEFVATESTDPCSGPDLTDQMTHFLSLDKCMPRRHYLSIVHIPLPTAQVTQGEIEIEPLHHSLEYDLEWLSILRRTHALTSTLVGRVNLPDNPQQVTDLEIEWVRQRFLERDSSPLFSIPLNFARTVQPHIGSYSPLPYPLPPPIGMMGNPQTDDLLQFLQLRHIITIPFADTSVNTSLCDRMQNSVDVAEERDHEVDLNEISLP